MDLGAAQNYSADELEKAAVVIIREIDLNGIIHEAHKTYAEVKEKGITESPVPVIDEDTE